MTIDALARCRAVLAFTLAVLALAVAPAVAGAAALETVLQDDAQLLHRPEDQLRRSLEEMKLLGVDRIRVTAGWSVLTRAADSKTRPEFDAADPAAYEQERWRNLDRLVVLAREYGFDVMIDIAFWAPQWATADAPGLRGRTFINAQEFAHFATAVARRYSGSFIVPDPALQGPVTQSRDGRYLERQYGDANPSGPTTLQAAFSGVAAYVGAAATSATLPLPKVDVFTLWNEPNHQAFIRPQWQRKGRSWVPRSPHIYRDMVLRGYPAVKGARPDATVLIGGTSYTGAYANRGKAGVPPLRFLRELACVDRKLKPLERSGCSAFSGPLPGDGWSHHPYSMRTEPDARNSVNRPDDVPVAELPRLAALLDALIRRGRLAPGTRPIWVTEYGYETNPPDPDEVYSVGDQARFLTWAEYIASRTPTVRSFAQFLLRDLPPGAFRVGTSKQRAFGQWQSGLLFENGVPKLAAYSFRAGLFAQRLSGGRLRLWGRLRIGDGPQRVVIEHRPRGASKWHPLRTAGPGTPGATAEFSAEGRDAFQRFGRAPRGKDRRYRLRYLDGDAWRTSPSVRAIWR